MRQTQKFGVLTVVAALGLPVIAWAQIPPVPPTPPVQAVPIPRPVLTPMPPVLVDPIAINDLQMLALDASKLASDMRLLDTTAIQDAARLAADRWRLSAETMRFDWDPIHLDWQNQPMMAYSGQSDSYSAGKELLNQRKYADAVVRFDRVITAKGANVEGALYWKAYAQYRLGRTDDAVATITQLRRDYAQSRYLADVKMLEADVKRQAGKPADPSAMDDDELKLLALQGLMRTDPERAIPLVESMLAATNSLRLKKNALYLLGLSTQPRARVILVNYAKGAGNPDLQLEAIRYIVANREKQQTSSTQLMEIYQSTQDTEVRLAIISALRASGDRNGLFNVVNQTGSPVVVRQSAVSGLSTLVSPAELWTLYEKETNKELRMQMVSAFGSMQAVDQLSRIAKTDKDVEIRRRAVRNLGGMKSEKTGQLLVEIYAAEQDTETRRAVISSLSSQSNAEGLVAIARKEAALPLKTEIVRRLSEMAPKSKVAADYLAEIIK